MGSIGRNIVLTGFMGTGKTTVGRALADRLGRTFVDTDALLTTRHGPIPEIFAERGEIGFREIEAEVVKELAGTTGLVIATGGGLVLDPDNVEALTATGDLVCLTAEPGEIVRRVLADGADARPLLAGPDPEGAVRRLLDERAAAYGRFPQVATDGRSTEEIVDEVVAVIADAV